MADKKKENAFGLRDTGMSQIFLQTDFDAEKPIEDVIDDEKSSSDSDNAAPTRKSSGSSGKRSNPGRKSSRKSSGPSRKSSTPKGPGSRKTPDSTSRRASTRAKSRTPSRASGPGPTRSRASVGREAAPSGPNPSRRSIERDVSEFIAESVPPTTDPSGQASGASGGDSAQPQPHAGGEEFVGMPNPRHDFQALMARLRAANERRNNGRGGAEQPQADAVEGGVPRRPNSTYDFAAESARLNAANEERNRRIGGAEQPPATRNPRYPTLPCGVPPTTASNPTFQDETGQFSYARYLADLVDRNAAVYFRLPQADRILVDAHTRATPAPPARPSAAAGPSRRQPPTTRTGFTSNIPPPNQRLDAESRNVRPPRSFDAFAKSLTPLHRVAAGASPQQQPASESDPPPRHPSRDGSLNAGGTSVRSSRTTTGGFLGELSPADTRRERLAAGSSDQELPASDTEPAPPNPSRGGLFNVESTSDRPTHITIGGHPHPGFRPPRAGPRDLQPSPFAVEPTPDTYTPPRRDTDEERRSSLKRAFLARPLDRAADTLDQQPPPTPPNPSPESTPPKKKKTSKKKPPASEKPKPKPQTKEPRAHKTKSNPPLRRSTRRTRAEVNRDRTPPPIDAPTRSTRSMDAAITARATAGQGVVVPATRHGYDDLEAAENALRLAAWRRRRERERKKARKVRK